MQKAKSKKQKAKITQQKAECLSEVTLDLQVTNQRYPQKMRLKKNERHELENNHFHVNNECNS